MTITPPKKPMEGGFSLDQFMPGLDPADAEAFAQALESADPSMLTRLPNPKRPKNGDRVRTKNGETGVVVDRSMFDASVLVLMDDDSEGWLFPHQLEESE